MRDDFTNDHPHNRRHADGWRRFEQLARRSLRNFGGLGNLGNWEGLEGNFRIGRMLASGDLRLVALYLIDQQPRHGYDLIKAVEDKTAGFYSPSPGIVYPALTYLEEAGFVGSTADGNKKLYTITADGRTHLAENRDAVESTLDYLGRIGRRWNDMRDSVSRQRDDATRETAPGGSSSPIHDRDLRDVIPEVNDARRALKSAIANALPAEHETQRRLAEILDKAARKIRALSKDDDIDI